MLSREDIIRKSYTPADLLDLLERFESLEKAVGEWQWATLRPGGADYQDDERLMAAYLRVKA